jgi:hypothetical protein
MTRRERIEARLERRRTWAESRDSKSAAAFDTAHKIVESIPLGQPILVGHHSEKRHRRAIDRMAANMTKGVESAKMADLHRSKAGNIEAALESSIYSDDPDAIEALTAKAAGLRAEAERCKAINKEIKKGEGWTDRLAAKGITLTEAEKKTLISVATHQSYYCDKKTGFPVFPGYHLTSLNANARRAEERIKMIEARNAQAAKAEVTPDGILVEPCGPQDVVNAYTRVTFAEKPDRKILEALKAAGYFWSRGSWIGPTAKLPEVR